MSRARSGLSHVGSRWRPCRERYKRHVNRRQRQARQAFLRVFPEGFEDQQYLAWERDYKVEAAAQWRRLVGGKKSMRARARRR